MQVWSLYSHGGASGAPPSLGRPRKEEARAKQQTCIDRNTRHSHPWSDVVGGEGGVSGWECTGGLRTGGREGEESVDGVRWE